jgi:glycosyltransferase involved in cell wall biosynthesis
MAAPLRVCFVIQGPEVAASRYRVLQYLPRLEARGIVPTVATVPHGWLAEWRFWGSLAPCDVVFLQRQRPPPSLLARARRTARRLVFDFDDALWYHDSTRPDPVAPRRARALSRLIRAADRVVAGNRFLADGVAADGGRPVVIPSPVDVAAYTPRSPSDGGPFTIGWIGAHGSLHYLERLRGALDAVHAQVPHARLEIVCDHFFECARMPVVKTPWSAATETAVLRGFDVGIMPLLDDPWSWGKCGLKALQYGAAGVPIACTPVGINRDVVRDGVEGRFAVTAEDWVRVLVELAALPPAARHAMGQAARARVEAAFSLPVCAERLADLLWQVHEAPGR